MDGGQTCITDPSGTDEPKKFSFDFSYWSHDGSKESPDGYYGADKSHPNGKKFCDQVSLHESSSGMETARAEVVEDTSVLMFCRLLFSIKAG